MSIELVCGNCKYWYTSGNIMYKLGEGCGICLIDVTQQAVSCDRPGCIRHSEIVEVDNEKRKDHH